MADRFNIVSGGMVIGSLYLFIVMASAFNDPIFRNRLRTCNAYSKPPKGGVCGPNLDEALEFVCGPGNFRGRRKRSLSVKDTNIREMGLSDFLALSKQNAQMNEQQESGDFGDVLIHRSAATNFLNKRIPFKQSGVACECCYHSCSVDEMLGYCEDRSKALIP